MIKRKAAMNRDQVLAKMHEYLTDSKATLLREIKVNYRPSETPAETIAWTAPIWPAKRMSAR